MTHNLIKYVNVCHISFSASLFTWNTNRVAKAHFSHSKVSITMKKIASTFSIGQRRCRAHSLLGVKRALTSASPLFLPVSADKKRLGAAEKVNIP